MICDSFGYSAAGRNQSAWYDSSAENRMFQWKQMSNCSYDSSFCHNIIIKIYDHFEPAIHTGFKLKSMKSFQLTPYCGIRNVEVSFDLNVCIKWTLSSHLLVRSKNTHISAVPATRHRILCCISVLIAVLFMQTIQTIDLAEVSTWNALNDSREQCQCLCVSVEVNSKCKIWFSRPIVHFELLMSRLINLWQAH